MPIDWKNLLYNLFYFVLIMLLLSLLFTDVFSFLYIFINYNFPDSLLTDKDLITPTIIFSSALLAFISYFENARNSRDTVVWKQKEQTVKLLSVFQRIQDILDEFDKDSEVINKRTMFNANPPEPVTHDNLTFMYQQIAHFHKQNHNDIYKKFVSLLIEASNLHESMAVQYNNDLLDKNMMKKLYYPSYSQLSFYNFCIFKGYLPSVDSEEHIKLLKEWDINYLALPSN